MSPRARPTSRRRSLGGLFGRILLTFVATALASAMVAAAAGYTFAARFSSEWIADVVDALEDHAAELEAGKSDQAVMAAVIEQLSEDLDAHVGLYDRRGYKQMGQGPDRIPRMLGGRRRELREGKPVVLRGKPWGRRGVLYGLPVPGPDAKRRIRVLAVLPGPGFRLTVPLLMLMLVLPVIGGGTWVLSRSLTRRLARIEASAGRIADGELGHRIALDSKIPRDELDQLATAFNEMAQRVEALLQGQRTLLANVSHELRTPIARMKVLVEILQERVGILVERGDTSRPVQRLDKGLREMSEDLVEIEALISDLLTSGRLELRHGAGGAVQATLLDVTDLLHRVAAKVDAQVDVTGQPQLEADELLFERLLSNLLANARRACPEGTLRIEATSDDTTLLIAVEDEGPGVDPAHRESIFEPFTRLDQARDRDRGGVGLGLYLCRQICRSHGGSIVVTARTDGRSGARFEVRLPLRRPDTA
ncbi:MAG: ATP-binding protein [Myxococcota bacterium]